VLSQSAREVLKAGLQDGGTDLVTFLLKVYESEGEEVNKESRGGISPLSFGRRAGTGFFGDEFLL
jgi:hypothetical protein